MNIRFVKLQSGTSDHLVVNAVDVPARHWAGLARNLCQPTRGAGADVLVGMVHTGQGRFDLSCLGGDGVTVPATVWTAAAAAVAIRRRYGYQAVRLRADHLAFEVSVAGQDVRVHPGGHQSAPDHPDGWQISVRYVFDGEIAHHAPASDLFAD
ncbi:hypothetical protein ABUL04_30880 [Micromonospora harpali]|uniref:Uncharacterized protein n=2 Tax=Micromonospora TaxID=1873 RepID=A0A0D0WYZ8_9ACTN|nr:MULTISPECIES: hypothetical protein [Micromonospora]KIR64231.1 hypothetical protein TK50_00405 [Micromonospora haikouensis]MDI5936807.1 hypothetical protein [Micromonospora sp. DH15]OON33432.1 hypothetical protein BSA16_00465 [Micromonospora sp. Rc5]